MPPEVKPIDAFRYPAGPHARRHGPDGYSNYRSYRPWLRDEFDFRCVYCLIREQWGRVTGEFDTDHFLPQAVDRGHALEYDNLIYACRTCNLRKLDSLLPDPTQSLAWESLRVYPDGTIAGLTVDAAKIIRVLCLNSTRWKQWRRTWIRIIELAVDRDRDLLKTLLGFPDDLPNLKQCRAPRNARPAGIEESWFARRERGQIPELFHS